MHPGVGIVWKWGIPVYLSNGNSNVEFDDSPSNMLGNPILRTNYRLTLRILPQKMGTEPTLIGRRLSWDSATKP